MYSFALRLAAVLCLTAAPSLAALRAGACAVDITPRSFPITVSGNFVVGTAQRADGKLHARAMVLDDGGRPLAIAVVDTLMMSREMLDRVKQSVSRQFGLAPERTLISATHTHSAPPVMGALGTDPDPDYSRFLEEKIAEALGCASKNLVPARAGWTVVNDTEHTNCRRWILRPDRIRKDVFGEPTVRANMHPGNQNPDFLGPSGPVDPGLTVLAFETTSHRPIAVLANYSMHYVGVGGNVISPDYYGPFAENVERSLGGGLVAMMSQGTSGDQQWMDYGAPRKIVRAGDYAAALADRVTKAYGAIQFRDQVTLASATTSLRLRRRLADSARLEWARKMVAEMGDRVPKNQQEVYAREQVLIAQEPERELTLQAMRIGEVGIAAFPNEVFAITGLKVKAQSPLEPTFNIELANGAEGYIPPPEQHLLGGYTTWAARTAGLETGAEPKIVDGLLKLLEQVAGKPRRLPVSTPGAYAKAVMAARPVAYWRLNEFEGTKAADASGRNRAATFEGGMALYLEGPPSEAFSAGHTNRAPQFAGGKLRAALEGLKDRYSLELWFSNYLPAGARPITGILFAMGQDRLAIGGTGRLVLSSGQGVVEGTTPIAARTWNHLVFVRDRDAWRVYLNGNQTPEIAGKRLPARPSQVLIAGDDGSPETFEGRIDEVAVFPRALKLPEIVSHYQLAR